MSFIGVLKNAIKKRKRARTIAKAILTFLYLVRRDSFYFLEIFLFWPLGFFLGAPLLKVLTPYEVEGYEEGVRLGNAYDGGYVIPKKVLPLVEKVYSYGIGNDISFEKAVVELGIPVVGYDHTIDKLPEDWREIIFHKNGLASKAGQDVDTFEHHLQQNNDVAKKILLKIDIDGAEWDVIDQIVDQFSSNIVALVLEAHDLYRFLKMPRYAKVLTHLESRFTLCHIHGNNFRGSVYIGRKRIPSVCELTFINNSLVTAKAIRKNSLPGIYDFPNNKKKKDIVLNFWK